MVEYALCKRNVVGSTPIISITIVASLQQSSLMVEHRNHTPGDMGSSPIFANPTMGYGQIGKASVFEAGNLGVRPPLSQ
jgi:hypothetical protein